MRSASPTHAQVQSGVARTGKWWGHEHFDGGEPDVLLFAKGIGSGYPFAGMATKDHLWDGLPPGTMGELAFSFNVYPEPRNGSAYSTGGRRGVPARASARCQAKQLHVRGRAWRCWHATRALRRFVAVRCSCMWLS